MTMVMMNALNIIHEAVFVYVPLLHIIPVVNILILGTKTLGIECCRLIYLIVFYLYYHPYD